MTYIMTKLNGLIRLKVPTFKRGCEAINLELMISPPKKGGGISWNLKLPLVL